MLGRLPYSSNYTFLVKVTGVRSETLAVYKPKRGERPLWDFPAGTLAQRELAAYVVSDAAAWHIVPPTIVRSDAPEGEGSLQLFIDHDPNEHYFTFHEERHEELKRFAAFDAVVNNADRKAGHVIRDESGTLWAVDHGLTFNVLPKLRTVIWAYAEERLGTALREDLEKLGQKLSGGSLRKQLLGLLSRDEVDATLERLEVLLLEDRFPSPSEDRPLPWPLI